MIAPIIGALLLLAGCNESCDLSGYTTMHVTLVQGAPAVAQLDGGCVIYTELTADKPGGEPARHLGESLYQCLTGTAPSVVSNDPAGAFYSEPLHFRIDGHCPDRDDFTYWGCFGGRCRTVDTVLARIGPQSVCAHGTPMTEWTDACWSQFYAVIGHEVLHAWLGNFH